MCLNALPAIFPITFRLVGESVLFVAPEDAPFARAASGTVIAFQADSIPETPETGWHILGVGPSSAVEDQEGAHRAHLPDASPWTTPLVAQHLVQMDLTQLSGHEFSGLEAGERGPQGTDVGRLR